MEIKAITKYDRKNYKEFIRFNLDKGGFLSISLRIALVIIFISTIILFAIEGFSAEFLGFTVYLAIILLLILLLYFFVPNVSILLLKKMIDMDNEFTFCEDELITISHNSHLTEQSTLKYNIFYKVYETKKYFYLYVNLAQAVIVSKDGIINGTDEELRNLILKHLPPKKYIKRYK